MGCYNANCPGFVQIKRSIYVGSPFLNISISNGPQFGIGLSKGKSIVNHNCILFFFCTSNI